MCGIKKINETDNAGVSKIPKIFRQSAPLEKNFADVILPVMQVQNRSDRN